MNDKVDYEASPKVLSLERGAEVSEKTRKSSEKCEASRWLGLVIFVGGGLVIFAVNWFLSPTRFWEAKQTWSKKFVRKLLYFPYL